MRETDKPDWLKSHLDSLPGELTPDRDLWPDIVRRIDHPARRAGIPLAMAAAVVLAVAVTSLAWHQFGERPDEAGIVETPVRLAELRSPFIRARNGYEQHWHTVREQMDPETAAVIEKNLEIIRRANAEIEAALRRQPGDPNLRYLMRRALAKEVDIYRRALETSRRDI